MPIGVVDGRSRWIETGFFSISFVSVRISLGIVALKNSVWRDGRQVTHHLADVRQEAHVEHPVGFVEHQDLELVELAVGRLQVFEQAARRRDDDVDAAAERVLLRAVAHAAEDGGAGDRRVHGQVAQVVQDLRRQLARRREHERARRAARLVDQPVQDGQQERGRLAAARLRGGEHVAAAERVRNGLSLDRRGPDESKLLDGAEEAGVKSEG